MHALMLCSSSLPPRAGSPTITVQAPQSPSAQPSLVPVQRASSRNHCSTVRVGAASVTSTNRPRWKNVIGRVLISAGCACGFATGVPADSAHYSAADMSGGQPNPRRALRADLLDFTGDPGLGAPGLGAVRHRPDHWLLIEHGRIVGVLPGAQLPGPDWLCEDQRGRLLIPGLIDTHVHSVQLDVI